MIKMKKPMHSVRQMMTTPVKKMADGGDFWGDILPALANTGATGPNTSSIAAPTTIAPMDINPYPEPNTPTSDSAFNWQPVSSMAKSLVPYASNIANSFRTPPQPHSPQLDSLVSLHSPSFNAQRNEVESDINSSNAAISRTVDGNTGAKIRLFNEGQKFQRLSQVNQEDHNMQLQTQNEQARLNSEISSRNTDRQNQFGDEQVERQIAEQRERSANLSNAVDKYVGIQNEQRKAQVDLDKTKTLSTLFTTSGVERRERQMLKDQGVPDPEGKNYSDLYEKKYGG